MRFVAAFLLVSLTAAAQQYTTTMLSRHVLTNESIVTLAKAGFDELFIIERIRTSRAQFDTSVQGLVALRQAGFTEDLIRAMALQELRSYPTPIEAQPAGVVQPVQVRVEKHWWGYRWVPNSTNSRDRQLHRDAWSREGLPGGNSEDPRVAAGLEAARIDSHTDPIHLHGRAGARRDPVLRRRFQPIRGGCRHLVG